MIQLSAYKQLNPEGITSSLDISLEIKKGAHTGIIGTSGAGKTTLLKILAGLLKPETGRLIVDGNIWFDSDQKINVPTQQRDIGFVFQDYALFPNMTARKNLEFAFSADVNHKRVEEIMEMLAISDIANQKSGTLSGGQKQRVALGRALIRDPKLLLLDEPLSALDPLMRSKLQQDLSTIARHFKGTMILVSHDATDVIQLTKQAFVLEKGKIVKEGTPAELLLLQSSEDNKPGIVEVIDLLPKEKIAILKSQHGLLHISYDDIANHKLKIGDKVSLKIREAASLNVLSSRVK